MDLRPYQTQAIDALRNGFRRGLMRQMLTLPTGAGKTTIAAAMCRAAVDRGNRALFICERITLVDQAAQRFYDEGLELGVIQGNHPWWSPQAPVQVASIQTLARRRWPDANVIFIDEAHIMHSSHVKILEQWNNIPVVGLSATPWARGLGKHFQSVVANIGINELIEQGYLVPAVVYGPEAPDMRGVKTIRGDFEEDGSAKASMKIIGDVVEHWIRLADNRSTAMFAVNIAHSKALVQAFRDRGICAEHIDAYTDSPERREVFAAFEQGKVQILSSVDVLGRGWDQPKVSCIMQCRPTKSRILHFQQIGRGLRPHGGKKDCLILDFADNHERLGFVTEPVPVTLDDGKKRQAKSRKIEHRAKECPSCKVLKPPKIHKCPQCGFAPERQSQVEHEDGELELKQGKRQHTMEEKRRWFGMLEWMRKQYGYQPGWTAHKYRAKFDVWPQGVSGPPIEPDDEVRRWVRSQQIRYAKRRNKDQQLTTGDGQ